MESRPERFLGKPESQNHAFISGEFKPFLATDEHRCTQMESKPERFFGVKPINLFTGMKDPLGPKGINGIKS